MLLLEML